MSSFTCRCFKNKLVFCIVLNCPSQSLVMRRQISSRSDPFCDKKKKSEFEGWSVLTLYVCPYMYTLIKIIKNHYLIHNPTILNSQTQYTVIAFCPTLEYYIMFSVLKRINLQFWQWCKAPVYSHHLESGWRCTEVLAHLPISLHILQQMFLTQEGPVICYNYLKVFVFGTQQGVPKFMFLRPAQRYHLNAYSTTEDIHPHCGDVKMR